MTKGASKLRMAPLSPARSRAEQIADAIAKDIVEGRLEANQKLSESDLAAHFQVSRGPIRDALDLLERNMLVTIKPRSYTVVNHLTIRELEQLFDFRKHALGLASKFAARDHKPEDLNNLRERLDELIRSLNTKGGNALTQAFPASQMWDAIIDASHSQVVRQACLHLTGGNIWSTAVEQKVSISQLPAYTKKRAELWIKLHFAIEAREEVLARDLGEALVDNNWLALKTAFMQYFPD